MAKKFNLDNLGAGLLSAKSKTIIENSRKYEAVMIPYQQLKVAEDNTYSVDDEALIDLAENIKDIGLQQPLVVAECGNGDYEILAGQRRYLAILKLIEQGNTMYETIPCKLQKLSDMDIPLSDDLKKQYIIAGTNEYRDLTTGDLQLRVKQLTAVYMALQEAGADISGRRREFIAESLHISPRSAQTLIKANENMAPELAGAIAGKKLSVSTIGALADLEKEDQQELAEKLEKGEKLDLAEVAKNGSLTIEETAEDPEKGQHLIKDQQIREMFKSSFALEKIVGGGVIVSEEELIKLHNLNEAIIKKYESIYMLLSKAARRMEREKKKK